jgi:hypothetical protein
MTKKRNWRIAGITAALLVGVVSFLPVNHGRITAGIKAACTLRLPANKDRLDAHLSMNPPNAEQTYAL